jgi:glycosyltransferase involved in cell wall biosynthesis
MEVVNTFVIPHLNNPGVIRCIDTLYKHTPDNFRLIVIDQSNGATDFSTVKDKIHLYIKAYRNLGFAKAANYGIRLADTKFVTILNDDVEFINKRWWPALEDVFEKFPDALAVNPSSMRRLSGVGSPTDYPGFPYKESYTEEEYQAMIDECSRVGEEVRPNGIHIDGITPWCVTFYREELLKCGLFDETFYPGGGEDYDLMNRCYLHWKRKDCNRGRWIGTSLSVAWHWWLTTKKSLDISTNFLDASALYKKKWSNPEFENPYPMGNQSKKLEELEMKEFVIKEL